MKLKSVLLPAFGLFFAVQASATPILVGQYAGNSGDAEEKVDVRTAITNYNSLPIADLSQLFGPGSDPSLINGWSVFVGKTTTVSPFFNAGDDKEINWTAPNTFTSYYVLTKWGQGQANFDHVLHFVSAGETLLYNPGGSSAPQGLSHLAIWASGTPGTNVPDAGSTISLLGAAFIGVAFLRKRCVR